MLLHNIHTVPIPVDMGTYIGNSHEYTYVHVENPYITMSLDLYVSLTELQFYVMHERVHFHWNIQHVKP